MNDFVDTHAAGYSPACHRCGSAATDGVCQNPFCPEYSNLSLLVVDVATGTEPDGGLEKVKTHD